MATFQANPETYQASAALPGNPLSIRDHLDAYIEACAAAGNSQNWRYQKRRYLEWCWPTR